MLITVDTSAVIAVLLYEPEKSNIIEKTRNASLLAPHSLHWEMGNAFSLMLKKKRIDVAESVSALRIYRQIPLQLVDVDLERALELAGRYNIYAYDAYILCCAIDYKTSLLTLDRPLIEIAHRCKIKTIGVN